MNNRQGCLAGLLQLFLLDKLVEIAFLLARQDDFVVVHVGHQKRPALLHHL